MTQRGSCLCRRVTYEITGELTGGSEPLSRYAPSFPLPHFAPGPRGA